MVSPATRQAVTRLPKAFVADCQKRVGRARVSHEMLQSQVEAVSPVFRHADAAREEMARLRRGIAEVAAEQGLRILAAGTHPLASWHTQSTTEKPRYTRLIDDFQIVGRRNLLCGMHVHVAVPAGVDRVHLMNRLMPWLPLFLALSTSSPFWSRERTGLLGYRQAVYAEWPRTGIPDFLDGQAGYDAFVDLLVRSGAIDGPGSLWWAIRPAARYPTLELRIADCCTHLDDALAIAALFRCLVRGHVRDPQWGIERTPMTRRVIEENRWRAMRGGIEATFIDEARDDVVPVAALLATLRERLADDARALDCEREIAALDAILDRGSSAHGQLQVYRRGCEAGHTRLESLREVVDWLVDATVPGLHGMPATEAFHASP